MHLTCLCQIEVHRTRDPCLLDPSGAPATSCNASRWFVFGFLLLGSCSWRAGVRADRLMTVASLPAMSKIVVLRLSTAAQEDAAEELEARSLSFNCVLRPLELQLVGLACAALSCHTSASGRGLCLLALVLCFVLLINLCGHGTRFRGSSRYAP